MKPVALSLSILTLALCAGCTSFQKKWDAVGQPGRYEQASRWDGRWTSARHKTANGTPDGGRLRCVIENAGQPGMLAHFHANWQIFAADYDVKFAPVAPGRSRKGGSIVELRGTHELPKAFGGTYRYDARIVGDRFSARYDSSYDGGTFEMTRQLTNTTPID